ncbi:hypothetical protein [Halosimplex marinum]
MPQIEVSEDLYRQIETESADGDIDTALWKMVGAYRRANNPEADTT